MVERVGLSNKLEEYELEYQIISLKSTYTNQNGALIGRSDRVILTKYVRSLI